MLQKNVHFLFLAVIDHHGARKPPKIFFVPGGKWPSRCLINAWVTHNVTGENVKLLWSVMWSDWHENGWILHIIWFYYYYKSVLFFIVAQNLSKYILSNPNCRMTYGFILGNRLLLKVSRSIEYLIHNLSI